MSNYTYQINYMQAVKRWCKHVDEFNQNCPVKTQKRTLTTADGEVVTRTFELKENTIKGNVKATGMHLIALYAEAWATANRMVHGMANPADVCINTNRSEMGAALNRSERSVYDHVQKLQEVGLVDKYQFCGRHRSFKLWISPKILFGEATTTSEKSAIAAPKTTLSSSVRQNLPLSDISLKKPSTTISKVDCGKTLKNNHGNNEDPHSQPQEGNLQGSRKPRTETRTGGARGGAETVDAKYKQLFAKWRCLPLYKRDMTLNFWLMARNLLYPGKEFSEQENLEAVLEIYQGVFGEFAVNQLDREWDEYYNTLVERVKMAGEWFHKNANRRPDMPWAVGKKLGYFDRHNNFGFAITGVWLEKDRLRKRENRVEYLLNQARIDFERLAANDPRPKFQHHSELQLFQHYQAIATTYGKTVVDKFHQQYLSAKAMGFVPAKKQRLTIRAQKATAKTQVVYVEPWMEMGEAYYSE